MNYNKNESQTITEFFASLETNDISYVVPRGYRHLPDSVPGGDIDLIVKSNDFSECTTIAQDFGFKRNSSVLSGLLHIGKESVQKPRVALEHLLNPQKGASVIRRSLFGKGAEDNTHQIRDVKATNGNIMIHLRNHVAYTSPMNGQQIRVDPAVERSLFENRKRLNGFCVPDTPDELVHLICRGVFDKDGDFPIYYQERCNELVSTASDADMERVRDLFTLVFFEANDLVMECVLAKNFNEIRAKLRCFSDY